MAERAKDDALRLAAVGLGGWGRNVLRAFSQCSGARLVRLCDIDAAALAAAGRNCPEAAATDDFEEVLADSTVDAVVLAAYKAQGGTLFRTDLDGAITLTVENGIAKFQTARARAFSPTAPHTRP